MVNLMQVRLESLLIDIGKTKNTITYAEVARILELQPPYTIHQITELLETMIRFHAKAGAPQLASLVISKARGGLPAPGFFLLLSELGLYEGTVDGEDARYFHTQEMHRCFDALLSPNFTE